MNVMSGPPTAVLLTLPLKNSTSISEIYPAAHASRQALVLMQRNRPSGFIGEPQSSSRPAKPATVSGQGCHLLLTELVPATEQAVSLRQVQWRLSSPAWPRPHTM
jgi:hypothetical protein